jgi:AcrR family transcriptional regulator
VRSGTLYHYFPSKEDLLLGVLKRYEELLEPVIMRPAFAATDDPIERIFSVLALYRRGLEMTHCRLGCPIGNLALELSDTHPHVREHCAKLFAMWSGWIECCLDAASDRLPSEVPRKRLSSFVLTVMEGGLMQARAHGELGPYDESVAALRDYMERVIAPINS